MSQLWRDTHSAAWLDDSLCVANSTGYSTTGDTTAVHAPPAATATAAALPDLEFANVTDMTLASASDGDGDPLVPSVRTCTTSTECSGWTCYQNVYVSCRKQEKLRDLCLPTCSNSKPCSSNLQCSKIPGLTQEQRQSHQSSRKADPKAVKKVQGLCIPAVDGSLFGLC